MSKTTKIKHLQEELKAVRKELRKITEERDDFQKISRRLLSNLLHAGEVDDPFARKLVLEILSREPELDDGI